MGNILENFSKSIEALKTTIQNAGSAIQEVRQKKHDVQQLQDAIKMGTPGLRYVREKNCLIISAPNIIIGNVDSTGRLLSGKSQVIVRGTKISNEASNDAGNSIIRNRATTIENIAVDPGMDGLENVVFENSKITNLARAVNIQSNNEVGAFSSEPTGNLGVNITSDSAIKIDALGQNIARRVKLSRLIKQCQTDITHFQQSAKTYNTNLDNCIKEINQIVGSQASVNGSDDLIAVHFPEVFGEKFQRFKELERSLYALTSGLLTCLSLEAEAMRKQSAFSTEKTALEKNAATFRQHSGTSISLNSEQLNVRSVDGDGVIRQNKEAGLFVNAPHVQLQAHDSRDALINGSNFTVNSKNVNISTASTQYTDENHTKAKITSIGDVCITSKNTIIRSVDRELDNTAQKNKIKETALTQGSLLQLRAENMVFLGTDTQGNSSGSLLMDAKTTNIGAFNIDPETDKFKEIATGSILNMQAEKAFIGNADQTGRVQIAADSVVATGKTVVELQQNGGGAIVSLVDNQMVAGGKEGTELQGNLTVDGNITTDCEITAAKVTADEVVVNKALQAPTMKDKQGSASVGSAGKPNASLEIEDPQDILNASNDSSDESDSDDDDDESDDNYYGYYCYYGYHGC